MNLGKEGDNTYSTDNYLGVGGSTLITLDADHGDAYGIWMLADSGTLDGTYYVSNITRIDFSSELGKKVKKGSYEIGWDIP